MVSERSEVSDVSEKVIRVSAVLVRRADGRVLQARKHGAAFFLFPGGKPEAGEDAVQAAVRELAEETGLIAAPEDLLSLGHRTTQAANEAGYRLETDVFALPAGYVAEEALAAVRPHAEIAALAWVAPDAVDPTTGYAAAEVLAAGGSGSTAEDAVRLAPLSRSVVAALAS